MASALRSAHLVVVLALGLVACTGEKVALSETQARDRAWQALEPNTSSHDQANWQFIEVRQVVGHDIADEFEDEPAPGCWQGPTIAPNAEVDPSGAYWYVHLEPRPATAVPPQRTVSPTEPPHVPEPFMLRASFLLDPTDGQVLARKLYCVIY